MTVRVRFAPSPTGDLHLGGARTALFNWLFARNCGGEFLIRLEDTDRQRSSEAAEQSILDGLRWLGLDSDAAISRQSEFEQYHREAVEQLLRQGRAYPCYCSPEELEAMRERARKAGEKPRYDGRCRDLQGAPPAGRDPVIRFRGPIEGSTAYKDLVYGNIHVLHRELDDLILRRADGTPTYNLCCTVDDLRMGVTHVIRGADHIGNTTKQILLAQALGGEIPQFAHLPLILNPDGQRMSKRLGAEAVSAYRQRGYLPEAVINYLARLGWSHGDRELFQRSELIKLFSLAKVQLSAAIFNEEKLLWFNRQHLQKQDPASLANEIGPLLPPAEEGAPELPTLVAALRGRASTVIELASFCQLFWAAPVTGDKEVEATLARADKKALAKLHQQLSALDSWATDDIDALIKGWVKALEVKFAEVGMPLRAAVLGALKTPPLGLSFSLLGRDRTLRRLGQHLA